MTVNPLPTPPLLHLGRLHAFALALFGPPDTPGHPYTGTKYDPRLKQLREQQRRTARRGQYEGRHTAATPDSDGVKPQS